MTHNEGKWQNGVYDEDRPSAYQIDHSKGNNYIAHGEEGHTGFKCSACAMMSENCVSAFPPHDDDHWQDQQLKWQEECDKLHSQKINHLPSHTPQVAQSDCCPERAQCCIYQNDPAKPIKQFERLGSRSPRQT